MEKRAGFYYITKLDTSMGFYTDVFQSVMHPLFQDIQEVECFIDDIGLFSSDNFEHHLSLLSQVLFMLEESVLAVNPLKCAWGGQSTDYLGFLLTIDGIKPLP